MYHPFVSSIMMIQKACAFAFMLYFTIACDVCTEAGVQLCKFHRIQAFNRHLTQHANKDELLSKYVGIPYQAVTLVSTLTVYYSLYMPAALNSCESKKSAIDDTKHLIGQWRRRLHACVTADGRNFQHLLWHYDFHHCCVFAAWHSLTISVYCSCQFVFHVPANSCFIFWQYE